MEQKRRLFQLIIRTAVALMVFKSLLFALPPLISNKHEVIVTAQSANSGKLQLFYVKGDEFYNTEESIILNYHGQDNPQNIVFSLPHKAKRIRLDIDVIGSIALKRIRYSSPQGTELWNPSDILASFKANSYVDRFYAGKGAAIIEIKGGDPYIEIQNDIVPDRHGYFALDAYVLFVSLIGAALVFFITNVASYTSAPAGDIAISALFLAALCFNFLNSGFNIFKDAASTEKRTLASRPDMQTDRIFNFPVQYEPFFNDHFSIRNTLIQGYSILKHNLFRVSAVPAKVLVGKKGWLYCTEFGTLDSFMGLTFFTAGQLETIRTKIDGSRAWAEGKGMKFYLLLIPEKSSVYPEYLPENIARYGSKTRLDQITDYLRKNSQVRLVDIRDELIQAKSSRIPLYFKTDTHWNHYGAFIASRKLLSAIAKDFQSVPVPHQDDYVIKNDTIHWGDLSDLLGLSDALREQAVTMEPKTGRRSREAHRGAYQPLRSDYFLFTNEIAGSDLPKAVVFSDSFGLYIEPFIADSFARSVLYRSQNGVRNHVLENEKPDIVVLMHCERTLLNYLQE